jgi:phosphatidylglycerophosphate synthase
MVATALMLLVGHDPRTLIVITAIVIIGREIAVSALREWMAHLGARAKVAVSSLGKWKTILQMVGLSIMMYREDLFVLPIYRLRRVAARHRRGAHALVDGFVPESGVAGTACSLKQSSAGCAALLTVGGLKAKIHGSRKFALVSPSGCSSVGRARPCQGRGHEFEPRYPLQFRT